MVRAASDTYYVTVGTILMNLGVPSKLIGCIPKVADRYSHVIAFGCPSVAVSVRSGVVTYAPLLLLILGKGYAVHINASSL